MAKIILTVHRLSYILNISYVRYALKFLLPKVGIGVLVKNFRAGWTTLTLALSRKYFLLGPHLVYEYNETVF